MVKQKNSKNTSQTSGENKVKIGFFKRFSFLFESLFIIIITVSLLWVTRFVDIPDLSLSFSLALSELVPATPLSKVITYISICVFGLVLLLIRYSLYLRKINQQQYVAEEEIKRLAFFDSLTNLPNQDLCNNRLEHALAKATRNSSSLAVLFIGIDNFKSVNDQLSHEGGDKLIKEIAKRLSKELRSGDTVARLSGVEFIILLEDVESKEKIHAFAETLLSKLAKCYRIAMREVYVTANLGVALYPADGDHSKTIIKQADTAMRFAKEKGRSQLAFFSKDLQEQVNAKNKIAEQLRNAMDNDEFVLHYQPIISTRSNDIVAVEALLRWHNNLLGDIAPSVFIPIAEEIGIINKIGDWVLAQACQQNKIWQAQGYPNLVVTINLSVMQFGLEHYASIISSVLDNTGLEPQCLELEFTENTLMKDIQTSRVQLKELSSLGVSIALDDFGTGYSSIKYLSTFKLNKLKIDGSFITNVPESKSSVMAVKGIIALAKELNFHVTAEGVETAEQCEYLSMNNVDSMQGYHFSRPVDVAGVDKLLQSPPWKLQVVNATSNGDISM